MSIRKIRGLESDFTLLPNDLASDRGLSWAARGMLLYLCSKDVNWDVSMQDLIDQTDASAKPSRRDAVRAIMRELQDTGYMRRSQSRAKGRYGNVEYEVSPVKFSKLPFTENPSSVDSEPETDNPKSDERTSANPPQPSKDINQVKKQPSKEPLSKRTRRGKGFVADVSKRQPTRRKRKEPTVDVTFKTKKGDEFLLKKRVYDWVIKTSEEEGLPITEDNAVLWLKDVAKRMRLKPQYAPAREQDIKNCLGSWLPNVTQRDLDNLSGGAGKPTLYSRRSNRNGNIKDRHGESGATGTHLLGE